jgi:hypothetical protein
MNHLNHFLIYTFSILFPVSALYSQTDTEEKNVPSESADTVIIRKTPVVIRKLLYIEEEVKPSTRFIEVFGSVSNNFNYYRVCKDCQTYLVKLKEATKPTFSYSGGANFIFMNKHLFTNLGVAYTNAREVFNYPGIKKSINNFNYLDLNISGGYRIKSKGLSVVIAGGGIVSQLLSLKGNTISETDTISMVDIKSQQQFKKTSYGLTFSLKFIYEISYTLSVVVEPYYRGDITSITRRDELYVQQRNFVGGKIGLLYGF